VVILGAQSGAFDRFYDTRFTPDLTAHETGTVVPILAQTWNSLIPYQWVVGS